MGASMTGGKWFDAAGKPDPAQAMRQGFEGAFVYVGTPGFAKNCTTSYYRSLVAAGLDVIAVVEHNQHDAELGAAAGGLVVAGHVGHDVPVFAGCRVTELGADLHVQELVADHDDSTTDSLDHWRWTVIQPAGNFGLVAINGAAGFWIRIGQWLNGDGFRDYQHAVMALSNGELIEAEPGGARIRPQSEYDGTNIIWSDWDLTAQQRADADRIGRALEGTPYSALDYFAIAAKRLHIPVPGLRRFIRSKKHEMCSALVDLISMRANIHLFQDDRWEGEVTPLSLRRALHGPVTA